MLSDISIVVVILLFNCSLSLSFKKWFIFLIVNAWNYTCSCSTFGHIFSLLPNNHLDYSHFARMFVFVRRFQIWFFGVWFFNVIDRLITSRLRSWKRNWLIILFALSFKWVCCDWQFVAFYANRIHIFQLKLIFLSKKKTRKRFRRGNHRNEKANDIGTFRCNISVGGRWWRAAATSGRRTNRCATRYTDSKLENLVCEPNIFFFV